MNPPALQIEALWDDPDMIEVRVSAANAGFAARTQVYVALGELASLGKALLGFPRHPDEVHEVNWGSPEPSSRQGLARLIFRCRTRAGSPEVAVHLVSSEMGEDEPGQQARFAVAIETVHVDAFARDLLRLEERKRGVAAL